MTTIRDLLTDFAGEIEQKINERNSRIKDAHLPEEEKNELIEEYMDIINKRIVG